MTSINPLLYIPQEPGYRLFDGALINAMNAQIIANAANNPVTGGGGFTLVNPPGFVYDGVTDQSLFLQNTLTSLALISGGATLKLYATTPLQATLGMYLNALIEVPSNIELILEGCPIVAGPNYGISNAGSINELPANNKPKLYTNITAGATSFQIVIDNADITPVAGNQFILRGQRQVTGKTLTKESGYIQTATDNGPGSGGEVWTIVPVTPIVNSYQVRYTGDAWELAHPGQEDLSNFTIAVFSVFAGNISAGSLSATVGNASMFNIGDYIYINDSETVGQATGTTDSNTIHNECNRIVNIISNTLYFQTALYHSYTTTYNGGVASFSGGENVILRGAKAVFGAADGGTKAYSYKIEYGVNCNFYDCEVSYATYSGVNYGPIGQAFRFQYSLNCNMWRPVFRGKPDAAIYGSGEGYAFVFVGSTHCKLMGHTDSNARHGLLLQDGTAGCEIGFFHSQGARISAVDTHGINARQNHIHDFTIAGGPLFTSDATQKAGIRLGNSSHTYGDFNNVVENGCIYNLAFNAESSGANQGYGIDYVVESGGNVVRNIYMLNVDYGVHSVDNGSHPTFALGADNVGQDIIVSEAQVNAVYFDGGSSKAVGGITLIDVTSDNNAGHFFLKNMTSVTLENAKIRNSVNTSGAYSVTADNITNLNVINSDFNGANRGISFQACPNAQILNNNLRNQTESVVYFDNNASSTNSNGTVWEGNIYTGTSTPTKTLGTSSVTIVDYGTGGGGSSGESPYLSSYIAGIYYPAIPVVTFSNKTASINELYAVGPFLAVENLTLSVLGVNVVTGITATAVALGVYTDNAGFPSSLVGGITGVVATATNTTDAEATGLSISITQGSYYWIAANFNGAVTISAAGSTTAFRNQMTTSLGNPAFVCKVASSYTGTLPSNFPSVTVSNFSTESAPHLWFRE